MKLRPATLKDAHYIKSRLRQADKMEVEVSTGQSAESVVPLSFEASTVCYAVTTDTDDRPVALYGVVGTPGEDTGIVWMLCTPRIKEVSKSFLKSVPQIVGQLQQHFPKLHNLVWARNVVHLRWIEAAGFVVTGAIQRNRHIFFHFQTKDSE